MPNETIDTLQLKINSDAKNASAGLDRLASSLLGIGKAVGRAESGLTKTSSAIKSFASAARTLNNLKMPDFSKLNISGDFSNLGTLARGLSSFADAAMKFKDIKAADVTRTASALDKLSRIDLSNLQNTSAVSNLQNIAPGLAAFAQSAQKLTTLDSKQINTSISALRRLAGIDLSGMSAINTADFSKLASLGSAFQSLSASLAGSESINSNIVKLISAISQLTASANNIPVVESALPGLSSAVMGFVTTMSNAPAVDAGTASIISALSGIASAGARAEKTAASLPGITAGVQEFVTALSRMPKLDMNVVRVVESLSRLSSAGGKAGSSARSLQRNITSLSSSMGGLRGNITKAFSGLRTFSRQLLAAAGVAGGLYTAFRGIKNAIDISSDLTEVQNVVDVTFGDMKQKVEDLAQTSIGDFGMSELTLKQISSRFQAMGVAMGFTQEKMSDMSIELTKLAADMASFYNVKQTDVAKDLESVFTGQTRPLRTYGLDLTQATLQEWALKNGIDANIQSMSQAEKTMLRYQYVLANMGAASGDFARTSGRLCAA